MERHIALDSLKLKLRFSKTGLFRSNNVVGAPFKEIWRWKMTMNLSSVFLRACLMDQVPAQRDKPPLANSNKSLQ